MPAVGGKQQEAAGLPAIGGKQQEAAGLPAVGGKQGGGRFAGRRRQAAGGGRFAGRRSVKSTEHDLLRIMLILRQLPGGSLLGAPSQRGTKQGEVVSGAFGCIS